MSVVLFSAGNPGATYPAAGLLRGLRPRFDPIALRNIDLPIIAPEVTAALAEIGVAFGKWRPRVVDRGKATPADLGITPCVPTRDT